MALDLKYGRVTTERGNIGDDEPVVVFRAQDVLLVDVLAYYMMACAKVGAGPAHLAAIGRALEAVRLWQWSQDDGSVKIPDTDPVVSGG